MKRPTSRILLAVAAAALVVPFAASCMDSGDEGHRAGDPGALLQPTQPPEVEAQQLAATPKGKLLPLRDGEQRMTLTMPETYTPSAPMGTGTDDYRCFLLDPQVDKDVWLTGSNVLPGNPNVVHHVILFKISPETVPAAEAKDAATTDPGWTCFGGTGLAGEFGDLDDANWLAAWAPGGDETKVQDGYGVKLEAGSRIVMQVHYNLLKGAAPDQSATQLRWMPGDTDLTTLHTFLMPAPVELPCRADHSDGPLCDREAASIDVKKRFGTAGGTNTLLHILCGTEIVPSETYVLHPSGQPRHDRARSCRPHAPPRSQDHHRGQPGHRSCEDAAADPDLGLRQPGLQADRPDPPRRR